jgi:hypothetical protein
MIHTLRDKKKLVAFYYFSYSKPDQQSPAIVLGTLLRQLLAQQQSPDPDLMEEYRGKRLDKRGINFEKLTNRLTAICSQSSPVTIVLDALDECAADEWRRLRHYLTPLALCPGFRLFVTSRPPASSVFDDLGNCSMLPISATVQDIAAFTQCFLEQRRDSRSARLINAACTASRINLADVLATISGGM